MANRLRPEIIITGAGASGLWMGYHLINHGFKGKILFIDQNLYSRKGKNWSFWAKEDEEISKFASFSWDTLLFETPKVYKEFPIAPLKYFTVRSSSFEGFMLHFLKESGQTEFVEDEIIEVLGNGTAICKNNTYQAEEFILSSIYDLEHIQKEARSFLWQHFYGRVIEFDQPVFKENVMGFMNFEIPQTHGIDFIYTLPFSDRMALVEYTIFSKDLLEFDEYAKAWDQYIKKTFKSEYWVLEEEFGKIPMTDFRFPYRKEKILYIGTAGGHVRGATGYGFKNMYHETQNLALKIISGKVPNQPFQSKTRHDFYDSVFLKVLKTHPNPYEIFESMFTKRNPKDVLKFLGKEGSLLDDLKIISACPPIPFIKALFGK